MCSDKTKPNNAISFIQVTRDIWIEMSRFLVADLRYIVRQIGPHLGAVRKSFVPETSTVLKRMSIRSM